MLWHFLVLIYLPVHRILNRSQLALFNFHFELWSSEEKVFCAMIIGKWSLLFGLYRPIIIKKQWWMTEGKINRWKILRTWRKISVRFIIHNTYITFVKKFSISSPLESLFLLPHMILWPLKSPNMINGERSCCSKLSKCWELRENDGGIYTDIWLFLCQEWQK